MPKANAAMTAYAAASSSTGSRKQQHRKQAAQHAITYIYIRTRTWAGAGALGPASRGGWNAPVYNPFPTGGRGEVWVGEERGREREMEREL